MREFWYEPHVILGNWPKTGFKLLFAPVALLGTTAVLVANSLVTAGCCYLSYRLAESLGSRMPLLAWVFLALQPLWLQMSFRCFPEALAGLVLLSALLSHCRGRLLQAALLVSYSTLIRQELYLLLPLYGVVLLFRKNPVAVLALTLFPVLYSIWGWAATGDRLFLVNQVTQHSESIRAAFPRHGFDHYFLMSPTIFGTLGVTFFFVYLGQAIFYRRRVHWLILVPLATYLLVHSLFNATSFTFGPATGGPLRYMTVISPLVAVLAAVAAERLLQYPGPRSRFKLHFLLVPLLLSVVLFMSRKHNNIGFIGGTDPVPAITTAIALAVVTFASSRKQLVAALVVCTVSFTVLTVRPIRLSSEDAIMKRVATWASEHDLPAAPVLVDHPMFFYYLGKVRAEFPAGALKVTTDNVDTAAPGTTILWDSHYSYRPEFQQDQLVFNELYEDTERFRILTQPRYFSDQDFWLLAFERK